MKTFFTFGKSTLYKLTFVIVLTIVLSFTTFAQSKYIVEASNFAFTPNEVEIVVGDTVKWINIEGFHNVNGHQSTFTSNPESFGNNTGTGWSYSYTFNTAGTYNYQCDPHAGIGMNGVIKVAPSDDDAINIIVNFKEMNPHIGQTLWWSVVDKESGKEAGRKKEEISQEFSVSASGIETGHSYFINFYADFNGNGSYDVPPVDHAWQLEIDNIVGDTVLNFTHNTNFTDIMWQNRLTLNFLDMDPHIGQNFNLAVIEKSTDKEVYRVKTTADQTFTIYTYGIEQGMSYSVKFYADFNENSAYDAPPTDHAWSINLNNVSGDTTLNFSHNAGMITDINWKNKLTIHFSGMIPHIGQNFWLAVVDQSSGMRIDSAETIISDVFSVELFGIENGKSYNIDFFADHNQNGSYDTPPVDHAWRLELDDIKGDKTLYFAHNINFTDIFNTTFTKKTNIGKFNVYPNPAADKVTIESEKINSNYILSLIDLTGKTNRVNWVKSNSAIEVDLKNFTPGMYILEIKNNSQRKMLKLIKE